MLSVDFVFVYEMLVKILGKFTPTNKQQLVVDLQKLEHVVAMTGVNACIKTMCMN
jgi:magnesium-transporting ATPase (P-type)